MSLVHRTDRPRYRVHACLVALVALPMMARPLQAQQAEPSAIPAAVWHADEATQLIGMPEVRAKAKGSLSITPDALIFTSPAGRSSIDRLEILAVTTGDVQVESGGTAGKITRAVIPFGGGAAVATVTHKQFSLLTVEFRDEADAFHGAVFLLAKDEAVQAQQQLGQLAVREHAEPKNQSCQSASTGSNTLKVASIATAGEPVPAEYQVLLYEQLVQRLREEATFASVYRDGNDSAAASCPAYTLTLTLNTFRKGNAALRASTGPVGLFVGATSLKFHALVQDPKGGTLLDKDFTVSKRGDSDSLDVTDKIAKELTKELKKASKRKTRSEAA